MVGVGGRVVEDRRCSRIVDLGGYVPACLDTLLIGLYVPAIGGSWRSRATSGPMPEAVGACRLRRLRLEALALPQLLGIQARVGLRAGPDADRL